LRHLRSTVNYFNDRELTDPLAPLRPLRPEPPAGTTRFQGVLSVDQSNAFVSSRLRPLDSLTAEIGLRFDHHSALDESRLSPRFHLAWQPRDDSVVRLAWGWFHQSQRPNELQVEDGETVLARSERAEHRILGFEHRREGRATVRVEAYQRLLHHPRTRFENLFDPTVLFPELTGDRIRIAPEAGRAQGIELSFRGADRGPLGWSLSYALSSIEDEIDGRWVSRGNDQPHAVRADLNYRLAHGWNLHAAWLYHTGWPTTRVTGEVVRDPDGSAHVEPVLGPFHAERLPAYHRLDARLSRTWTLPLGQLDTYLEVQNLYDRENVRGFDDFSFGLGAEGEPSVDFDTLSWGEFLPSFGIRWQF
jgi:outer membrane receptor protein involved in Fe transport